ncbi:hypothetical protein Tco_0370434 [Tanacetum coccineum]
MLKVVLTPILPAALTGSSLLPPFSKTSIVLTPQSLYFASPQSLNTKFAKPSILGKPVIHQHRNHSVARQPIAFKSEQPRLSKRRFTSQVDVNNNLTKPVTPYYFPNGRESVVTKPHHMIAPNSSRYSSNDMVHNHYLEEAKKRTQEKDRNSEKFF